MVPGRRFPWRGQESVLLGTVDHLIETGPRCSGGGTLDGSIDHRQRLIPYLPGKVVTRVDLARQLSKSTGSRGPGGSGREEDRAQCR